MLELVPIGIRLVRPTGTGRRTPLPRLHLDVRRCRFLLASGAASAIMTVAAVPAGADSSSSVSATINTVIMAITVSPSTATFGACGRGNSTPTQLGFPNGLCYAPVDASNIIQRIAITNTGGSGHVDVQGIAARPNAGTGSWALCLIELGPTAPPPCSGRNGNPGVDEYALGTVQSNGPIGLSGFTGTWLATTPLCDDGIDGGAAADPCALAAGASKQEFLQLIGPSAATNPSGVFAATITWIISV